MKFAREVTCTAEVEPPAVKTIVVTLRLPEPAAGALKTALMNGITWDKHPDAEAAFCALHKALRGAGA